ncbi:asparagine synthase (glutamine-hydrolyzing) [Miniphocaeibacter massiliensis]|uniref:asparagine synthase (glutamine-hydrolyzing) n=1 Tax=Miniphocaeibacter massiliensis TaxID=2041841 RepID=UPI000C1C7A5B|nr:asparagine synthase (glutamine-hydrolyzing) [Miniphocaeibacter massiliensis]
MCGTVGIYNPNKIYGNYKKIIKDMADEIIHRGPNSDGYHIDESVAFGFRRLSMVDLSSNGSQPFYTKNKDKVMVFNGEIYNYKGIKKELLEDGYEFISKTDSEVLLYGYDKWGEKILDKVRGMFGFAVWNKEKEELFIARDFFGIKPLYYTRNTTDGSLLFGSEIKSFTKNPNFIKEFNENMLKPYLEGRQIETDETFFKGVYKLKPGHFLKMKNNNMEIKKYWNVEVRSSKKSKEEYIENIKNTIQESIDLHKETDTELGAFLTKTSDLYVSNSSSPVDTFGFAVEENKQNIQEEFSKEINAKYHEVKITPEDCFKNIERIQYLLDDPNPSFLCMEIYFLSQEARKYVTAIMTGDGAEELFIKKEDVITKEEIEYNNKKVSKILNKELAEYIEEINVANNIQSRISQEKLLVADKMSSAQSMEMRSPFIDRKVVEEIYNVPKDFSEKELEEVLKKLLEEVAINKIIKIENPINNWLKEEKYFNIVKEELNLNVAKDYLDSEKIEELLEDKKDFKYNLIWRIYTFLLWYKEYFVNR